MLICCADTAGGNGTAMTVPVFEGEKMLLLEFPIYMCVFSLIVCRTSGCQSMIKPSLDIFEALSIQSCIERTGAPFRRETSL